MSEGTVPKRTAVIMQPTYLPWLGYFELMVHADVFVFLDCVQFEKQEWGNRNRLKGANGKPLLLTIPVQKHPLDALFRDITIGSTPANWRKKHLKTIQNVLGKSAYFKSYWPDIVRIFSLDSINLDKFTIPCIEMIQGWLGLDCQCIRASSLGVEGKRTELLLNICKAVRATHYHSPAGAAVYLEEEKNLLGSNGISISYQQWEHPEYPQLFGPFVSHLSALDAILNVGGDEAARLIGANHG
jgi:hypothetical protein